MGRFESAEVSIGIKILLSDLLSQINENNFKFIKEHMLEQGYIEDDNEYFNGIYREYLDDGRDESWDEYKAHFGTEPPREWSRNHQWDGETKVVDQFLLIPVKRLLDTERWGYDRSGFNSTSRPLDFDLSVDLDIYKEIKNFDTVLILCQNAA